MSLEDWGGVMSTKLFGKPTHHGPPTDLEKTHTLRNLVGTVVPESHPEIR